MDLSRVGMQCISFPVSLSSYDLDHGNDPKKVKKVLIEKLGLPVGNILGVVSHPIILLSSSKLCQYSAT